MPRLVWPIFCLLVLSALAPARGRQGAADPARINEEAARRHILVTLPQRPARPLLNAGSTPRGYRGGSGYRTSQRVLRTATRLARAYGLERLDEWPIQALDVHCVVYEVPGDRDLDEILRALASDERVDSVQAMGLFRVLGRAPEKRPQPAPGYDDPYLELQHALTSMQIEPAHRWARGAGVRVAIVDTGVDVTHPELADQIGRAENFVDDDARSFTSDVHGTAVAGVIASAANNGIGIVGVAPSVELLALKACWAQEAGSIGALCSTFTLAKAISVAIARRAEVLNLSLTGPADPLLSRLVERAIDRGIVVVSAADPDDAGGTTFPSGLGRVIVVSASGTRSQPARLHAPGDEIFTTMPYGAYDFLSGSSLAAAHVSGLVALLLEHDRSLSSEQIVALLRESGGAYADGVNGCRALADLRGSGTCPRSEPALTAR